MGIARVVSTCAVGGAVVGCAVLAISMATAAADRGSASRPGVAAGYAGVAAPSLTGAPSAIPALRSAPALPSLATTSPTSPNPTPPHVATPGVAGSTGSASAHPRAGVGPVIARSTSGGPATMTSPPGVHSGQPRRTNTAPTSAASSHQAPPAPRTTRAPGHVVASPRRGHNLPLGTYTGSATQVITVVAGSTYRTTATLQAWTKAAGGGWWRVGSPMTAHVGSDGMTRHPSESRSATPIGSFTLTRAFGHYADPGTALPYRQTSGADWWISQSGPLYNTLQHCWSGCAFHQGSPNEHLYSEMPYYGYAVVIDYNTPNAGPVRQGAGSAIFLHVSVGAPTAGCVSIPQGRLVSIMRWLRPAANPRILIGTS